MTHANEGFGVYESPSITKTLLCALLFHNSRRRKVRWAFGEGGGMTQLDGTPRMMREMAQQIRELVKEGRRPIAPRMRDLVNQLEQAADIEAAIARSGAVRAVASEGVSGF